MKNNSAIKKEKTLFGKALVEGLSRKYEKELVEIDLAVETSSLGCAAIEGMIAKARKERSLRKWLTAALIAATLLLFAGCAMYYVQRTEFKTFYAEEYGVGINLFFYKNSNAPTTIEDPYTLGYIPEGYVLKNEIDNLLTQDLMYENEQGKFLRFIQSTLHGHIDVDAARSNYTVLTCDNHEVFINTDNDQYLYLWSDGKYKFTLIAAEEISLQELQKIVNGVTPKA